MKQFAQKKIIQGSFEATLQRVRDTLKANGFGTITEVDFQKTFKEKIGKDVTKSVQLGACNPQLAFKVYSRNPENAILLPCHVCVIEQEGGNATEVVVADPIRMFGAFMDPNDELLKEVANDAATRLNKFLEQM